MPAARRRSGAEGAPERGRASSGEKTGSRSGTRLSARDAARKAAEYVQEMTGHDPESVTSLSRTDDGWQVGVEVVESRRVPDSTDILAVYRVDVDGDGDLISYKRDDRYYRGRADKG
ncbi:gas vesicle protein [Streptomyces sp. NPDC051976]|uniref:gas vesicle protein GvpO n=1 Tax=Streptomyces sp. NPDC051976 TaxID=3154947 RepID=UPI003415834D